MATLAVANRPAAPAAALAVATKQERRHRQGAPAPAAHRSRCSRHPESPSALLSLASQLDACGVACAALIAARAAFAALVVAALPLPPQLLPAAHCCQPSVTLNSIHPPPLPCATGIGAAMRASAAAPWPAVGLASGSGGCGGARRAPPAGSAQRQSLDVRAVAGEQVRPGGRSGHSVAAALAACSLFLPPLSAHAPLPVQRTDRSGCAA